MLSERIHKYIIDEKGGINIDYPLNKNRLFTKSIESAYYSYLMHKFHAKVICGPRNPKDSVVEVLIAGDYEKAKTYFPDFEQEKLAVIFNTIETVRMFDKYLNEMEGVALSPESGMFIYETTITIYNLYFALQNFDNDRLLELSISDGEHKLKKLNLETKKTIDKSADNQKFIAEMTKFIDNANGNLSQASIEYFFKHKATDAQKKKRKSTISKHIPTIKREIEAIRAKYSRLKQKN